MPPTQALVASRPFSDVHQPAPNLTYVALSSLSFFFICGTFLVYRSIVRRHHPIHESAHHNLTNLDSAVLLSNGAKKRVSFSPTVSALVTQSAIVASSPLCLKIIPSLQYPSTPATSLNLFYHGFQRPLLASTISLTASSSVASSKRDDSRNRATTPLLSTLHQLRATRILKLFPCLRRQPTSSDAIEDVGSHGHPSDQMDPTVGKDEPEPDTRVPDAVNIPQILRSVDDAECKSETPVIPFIILSLPSNEPLAEDPSQPCSLDENLLTPEGTSRSAGLLARVEADTHDINDATRLALASRLGERRNRPIPLPPPNILGTPNMAWPRWF